MQLSGFYPVLAVEKSRIEPMRDFYVAHFGFDVAFEADWYVSLKRTEEKGMPCELAILQFDHPTLPAGAQKTVAGLLLNFEVADVDAAYQQLIIEARLPLARDIVSEDFGQRHFITRDPAGVLVDVITPIAPSAEFAANYAG